MQPFWSHTAQRGTAPNWSCTCNMPPTSRARRATAPSSLPCRRENGHRSTRPTTWPADRTRVGSRHRVATGPAGRARRRVAHAFTRIGRHEQRSQLANAVAQDRDRRSQPMRSAITVAGSVGNSPSSSRIRSSTASTAEPLPARSQRGGSSERSASGRAARSSTGERSP